MHLDHLLYVGPDLGALERAVLELSGVRAAAGGSHPGQGTRNALIGLGPAAYLELMAPDPDQAGPAAGDVTGATAPSTSRGTDPSAPPPFTFLRAIGQARSPQLLTWCARLRDAVSFTAAVRALGFDAERFGGSRLAPDGSVLRWDLVVVGGHAFGGCVPFFIDWLDSPHPAAGLGTAPAGDGLALEALALRHPRAGALTDLLARLSLAAGGDGTLASPLTVAEAETPGLVARLRGRHAFELTGRGGVLPLPS